MGTKGVAYKLGILLLIGMSLSCGREYTQIAEKPRERETHGGDNVETLFLRARRNAEVIITSITPHNVSFFRVSERVRKWLLRDRHIMRLIQVFGKMQLQFQNAPCEEAGEKKGACAVFDSGRYNVIISYEYNKNTTPAEAIALLFHEAGHFLHEEDHQLLRELGLELLKLASPIDFVVELPMLSDAEITAQNDCAQNDVFFNCTIVQEKFNERTQKWRVTVKGQMY